MRCYGKSSFLSGLERQFQLNRPNLDGSQERNEVTSIYQAKALELGGDDVQVGVRSHHHQIYRTFAECAWRSDRRATYIGIPEVGAVVDEVRDRPAATGGEIGRYPAVAACAKDSDSSHMIEMK